ncbi:MAG: class I SAM-dependent methyltransferase [Deltaproteobacteria bacterium]
MRAAAGRYGVPTALVTMDLDVVDLRDFYQTPLGLTVRRIVGADVRARWRGVRGGTVVGLGYGVPYLGSFRQDAARVAALMPETQGALVWPSAGPLLSVLVEDRHLPLPDNSVDRLLLVHSLEAADRPATLLREVWRVLVPEGRLLIVTPNRRSVWARIDATPFGHGRPYSRSQLERLLVESLFTPVSWGTALHMPPINRGIVLKSALVWERVGRTLWPGFGGVLLVEARKEVMAPIGGKRAAVRALSELVAIRREAPSRKTMFR